ncbi:SgcJ/EcaC family oxidoreductase [Neobacillus sp. PS3-40]|uniref:SgcJ/EcaC family oxidoreductase n=1 Tax=Neobacillus sp. PS3-40 TaxID=3070679 RepID=UPI0027E1BD23|nr:SgcJ/EcaC family oxidoreductase [Neobacillus sp. PS3-40]WML43041.1 SgcJ/EcaC family oxidoreductase [Neobacillus sp. PS3-40]
MNTNGNFHSIEENLVRTLYKDFIQGWNNRDAGQMANLFSEDGNMIGFDGSQMNGKIEMDAVLSQIFIDHPTGSYVGIIREVRFLSNDVAVLRAEAGMVPHGHSDINPAINSVQTIVAMKKESRWYIAVFQNTPAAFHGRPKLTEQLTAELRKVLGANSHI